MFTGIIEGLGTITHVRSTHLGKRLAIRSDFELTATKIGDSIAVCGACLTVVKRNQNDFEVDVAPETLKMTTLDRINTGERVNLERALRLSDRLDGHLVSGHIDGIGHIKGKKDFGNAIIVSIGISQELARYVIKKGSVAVDGISLTVNDCSENHFELSIIPHTAKITTIGIKKNGDQVNIETDMIGKYVERFVLHSRGQGRVDKDYLPKPAKSAVDMEFLAQKGFL